MRKACGILLAAWMWTSGIAMAAATQESMAQQMLTEVNLARTAPQRYAELLREVRRNFHGKWFRVPGSVTLVQTKEGVRAVDEAIRFLSSRTPLKPLTWSAGLARASADLVRDQSQSGALGHSGAESGDPRQRIEKHGTWRSRIAENIGYGPTTARLMVMQLIIDDGVPERGHRKNIFTPGFTVAGAACGAHPLYGSMCVMDFADGFKP